MKKLCLLLAVLLLLTLAGCGVKNVKIEDHSWELLWVDKTDGETMIVCSPDYAEAFDLAETVSILDMTATAQNGKLVLTDNTGSATYELTYEQTHENKDPFDYEKGTSYNVTLGESKGFADSYSENPRAFVVGGKVGAWVGDGYPALRIVLDGYSLVFLKDGAVREMFPDAFAE